MADLIYGSSFDESSVGTTSPISDWFDYDRAGIPIGATQINHNTFVAKVTAVQVLRALMTKGHSAKVHHSLLSVLHALRADSANANDGQRKPEGERREPAAQAALGRLDRVAVAR